jgi:polyisoprenoid-binding protein YceI
MLVLALGVLGCAASSGDESGTPVNSRPPRLAAPDGPAESAEVAPVPLAAAPPGALALAPANSKIEFLGTKAGGQHTGGFKNFSGSVELAGGELAGGRISVEIDMNSVWSDNPKLTGHLKTADFFEVRTYPKASFVTTSIQPSKEDGATHKITGDLTLHGKTNSISFPAQVTLADDALTLNSKFTISRKAFGIVYGEGKIHDPVTLTITVRVPRK